MTDKDTPTPSNTTEYNIFERFDDAAKEGEHMDDLECWRKVAMDLNRETAELRQQLAALEQKRREDLRKCEQLSEYIPDSYKIRAAFPDVFKEKDNEG